MATLTDWNGSADDSDWDFKMDEMDRGSGRTVDTQETDVELCNAQFETGRDFQGVVWYAKCARPSGHSEIMSDVHLNSDMTTWFQRTKNEHRN